VKLPPDERLRADVGTLLETAGEPRDSERLDPLVIHLRLLARWNEAYNLTRITAWADILDRHLRESLLPLKWIARDRPGRLLDVGSGNGFPALPILACRPWLRGVLLERSERKGLFLEAVVQECGWAARVAVDATDAERYRPGRMATEESPRRAGRPAETSAADIGTRADLEDDQSSPPGQTSGGPERGLDGPGFDYVISRATLAPRRLLELAGGWVKPGGHVLLLAGEGRLEHDVRGRRSVSHELSAVAHERIPGRKSSYLHVFQRSH